MQIMQGDLLRSIERLLPSIGHIQIADNPGRHEPGTGEIHYPYLFELIDRLGYTGWVGCEYKPLTTTSAGRSPPATITSTTSRPGRSLPSSHSAGVGPAAPTTRRGRF